ncbi:MAG: sucrase ferredoxin, partial [Acidimicrobiia bacterium]
MNLRCAAWAREAGVDPVGTAGSYSGFLCVEWRRPWPRDLSEVEALAPLVAETARRGLRLQGILAVDGRGPACVVLHQNHGATGFIRYRRSQAECGAGEVVDAALALLDAGASAGTPAPDQAATDVLVCTHGRRDTCCGSMGTALLGEMDADGALPAGSHLWATTHTGGHRFAPNAIVLPEGMVWGFLDARRLGRIVRREGPLDDLLPHYRGCAGLGSPALQALERAVLGEVGWELFDCARTGVDLGPGQVRLDVTGPDGSVRSWEAEVVTTRLLPIPDCGQPLEAATKTEPELAVR